MNYAPESPDALAAEMARCWSSLTGGQPCPGGDVVHFLARLTRDAVAVGRGQGWPHTLADMYRRVRLLAERGTPVGFLNPDWLARMDEDKLATVPPHTRIFRLVVTLPPEVDAAFRAGWRVPPRVARFLRRQYQKISQAALAEGAAVVAVDDYGILYP
jgi:hypothetical protein